MKKILLLIIMTIPLIAFSPGKGTCSKSGLKNRAAFPVGTAIDFQKLLNNERYRNIVISEFNSITPEKSMKAMYVHPGRNSFEFAEVDYLLDFCRRNKMRLHGHTLVWYKDNPRWMEKFRGSAADWDLILKTHIQTIVGHCRGQVAGWDVVNEAFNDDGTLRDNIWLRNLGEEYIEKAFRYAAEADPEALLFYNDYDLESREEKLDATLRLLSKLRDKGVKIDGIGLQMHIAVNAPYISDINMASLKIAGAGFRVHYSEFDVTTIKSGKLFTKKDHLLHLQGNRVHETVKGFLNIPENARYGITMWGVSDADSWLNDRNSRDRPLLFDSKFEPKPAYCGFLDAVSK
jgi:endo-1,4-beta-xylanase